MSYNFIPMICKPLLFCVLLRLVEQINNLLFFISLGLIDKSYGL